MRKVLLLEPNYHNKYPSMGLMKLATYYRNKKYDVRFFKGDLNMFASSLLCEEFLNIYPSIELKKQSKSIMNYIKTGQNKFLDTVISENILMLGTLQDYHNRFKNKIFPKFDIVCVTTLFTFYWKIIIDTINFAKYLCSNKNNLYVGGIAASIVPESIEKETGIKPIVGLLDKPGIMGKDETIIDILPLDYSILDEIDYKYPLSNAYFAHTTRGCIRKCLFCSVPVIEPNYCPFISITKQVATITRKFGKKKDLLLMDNNVLASKDFNKIVDEINHAGFSKGTKYKQINKYDIAIKNIKYNSRASIHNIFNIYEEIMSMLTEEEQGKLYYAREKLNCLNIFTIKIENIIKLDPIFRPLYNKYFKPSELTRYIDFNQGIDARLVTEKNMKKLAEVNIRPLRIAFDNWNERGIYQNAVECAIKAGIKHLSNYMLYNFNDKPIDLYRRLKLNVELCEKWSGEGISIYSFPMKYHPIKDEVYFRNRNFIGKHWNKKYIRAVQAVLNSTKGKIGRGKTFFEEAFGKNEKEFEKILLMPETFIIYRFKFKNNLTKKWWAKWIKLTSKQKENAKAIIINNDFSFEIINNIKSKKIKEILRYYTISR